MLSVLDQWVSASEVHYPKEVKKRSTKRHVCRSGTWRAWVRKYARGTKGKCNLALLAASHRSARDANTAEYQAVENMAEVASMRGPVPAGCNRFGPTLRRSMTRAKAIQHEAFVASTAGMEFLQLGAMLSGLANHTSMPHALKAARLAHRAQASAKRQEEHKDQGVLHEFQRRFGNEVVERAVSAFPFLKKEELEAVPAPHGLYCLQYKPQTVQKATAAVAYTFQHR
eukprot:3498431-Amphidinium_carterae.1